MSESNSAQCPLCGQSNRCAIAAGLSLEQCWCMSRPVAPAVLQRLPPEQRGLACICPQCARAVPAAAADIIEHPATKEPPCPLSTSK
ncbi:MAG TPA: cysteine-rich CWC family protein [Alicycliphilus sp.]|nr:cysteine-rich CWC family protein [Alicycliphilus sp.]